VRVGISGWRYAGWRGKFYPPGLQQARELEYAAQQFDSIELNGSFYSLQRPAYFRTWYEQTPPGFVFAVKGGRFITHMKKLRDVRAPLANFFASGIACLGDKLGPFLWQFPEQLGFVRERFEQFFELLPRDARAATRLAREHDARVEGRSETEFLTRGKLRHAIEVRSRECQSREFVELVRSHDLALVVADTAGRWPYFEELTSDFAYVRLHGDEELYTSGYSPEAVARWADRVRSFAAHGDAYVYFDNDAKVHAPFDAMALASALGQGPARTGRPARRMDKPRETR